MKRALLILALLTSMLAFAKPPAKDCERQIAEVKIEEGLATARKYLDDVADHIDENFQAYEAAFSVFAGKDAVGLAKSVFSGVGIKSTKGFLDFVLGKTDKDPRLVVYEGCVKEYEIDGKKVNVPTQGNYYSLSPHAAEGGKIDLKPLESGSVITVSDPNGSEVKLKLVKIGKELNPVPLETAAERCELCKVCAQSRKEKEKEEGIPHGFFVSGPPSKSRHVKENH
ncbi:MAG: hypothetical protein R3B54_02075 [Bdellovibrionota bacterium]